MSNELTFHIDQNGKALLPEGDLSAFVPFVKMLCDTDTEATARLLSSIPKEQLGKALGELMLDGIICRNPAKVAGLVDAAEKIDALEILAVQKNSPLAMLASIGDVERATKIIDAAIKAGELGNLLKRKGAVPAN